VPLEGEELAERREALRRRNRGSRQRARENRRVHSPVQHGAEQTGNLTSATVPPTEPSVLLHDEDWGDAVVDLQLLLDEDLEAEESVPARSLQVADPRDSWLVVPWAPPPPDEVMLLPGGLPVTEFTSRVSGWRAAGLTINQTVDAAVNLWGITSVDLPLLSLAVQLVAASRQVFSFDNLEAIQQRLLEGGSIPDLLQTVIETLVVTAAQR